MKYRTATIMEEDALNQPTAAGEIPSVRMRTSPHFNFKKNVKYTEIFCALAADLSLHTLSESLCGSLVVYVIPESSSLLPEVKTVFSDVSQCGATAIVYFYPTLTQGVNVYIGQRRTALMRVGTQIKAGRTLNELLAHLKPGLKQVLQVMSFSRADITAALSDRVRLSPGNKESIADSMRAFKSSPGWSSLHSS